MSELSNEEFERKKTSTMVKWMLVCAAAASLASCRTVETSASVPPPPPTLSPDTIALQKTAVAADFWRRADLADIKDRAMRSGRLDTFEFSPDYPQFTEEVFQAAESATYVVQSEMGFRGTSFAVKKDETGMYFVLTGHQLKDNDGNLLKITSFSDPKDPEREIPAQNSRTEFIEGSDLAVVFVPASHDLDMEGFNTINFEENHIPDPNEAFLSIGFPEDFRMGYSPTFMSLAQMITVPETSPVLSQNGSYYEFKGKVNFGSSGSLVATVVNGEPIAVGSVQNIDKLQTSTAGYSHLTGITDAIDKLKGS